MEEYYIPLKKKDYRILDEGETIKCPYKDCEGRIFKKSDLNGEEICTEYELDESIYYTCDKNPKHFWGFRKVLS